MNNSIEARRQEDAEYNPQYRAFLQQVEDTEKQVWHFFNRDEEEMMCFWLAYLTWIYDWQDYGESAVYD
jgi:hypothetical protein